MTGREITEKALNRLGYTAANGNAQLTQRIMNKAVDVVNDVYADLWDKVKEGEFAPISSLSDTVELPPSVLHIMVYGVAAFLAQSENDGDQQQWWISVYNSKRLGLSKVTKKKDVLPTLPRSWMQ